MMKTLSLFASLVLASSAFAADLKDPKKSAPVVAAAASPWDFAYGAKLSSDYNLRGISQSDRGPSVSAYGELKYDLFYTRIDAYSVKLPTKPLAEIDLSVGYRPTFGKLTLDIGAVYYLYAPRETQLQFPVGVVWTPTHSRYAEVYFKTSYDITDAFNVGTNSFYTNNLLNLGAYGSYNSLTAKYKFNGEWSVSGEFGRNFLGKTSAYLGGVQLKTYNYGNLGVSYSPDSLKNKVTFDLRAHGTSLNKGDCFNITSDPAGIYSGSGQSKWCGNAIIGSVSFDTTWGAK
jgi:uncharacterized protein (TIGR02001 family)